MTITAEPEPASALQFSRVIYCYDRGETEIRYTVQADTVFMSFPSVARPGEIQNSVRANVPIEVQAALLRDFPVLRRFHRIAEADQPHMPVEHPYARKMSRMLKVTLLACLAELGVIGFLVQELAQRR